MFCRLSVSLLCVKITENPSFSREKIIGGGAALKRRRPPPMEVSRKMMDFQLFLHIIIKNLIDKKNYKKLYVYGSFSFLKKLHFTLPLREKTPSITQKPQTHCYFCNFDLKVVQIHPFWLIFCLQALFDLPDSILIVSRPQMAKKHKKSKIL